jgi:hypothetical protein
MKTTKTEKTLPLTTHKATTPAPVITRTVMLVTPALAAEWLKSNTNNRALSEVAVRAMAAAITDGRWVTTHQGIAFDRDGTLIDGQHRLHAIVLAALPVTMEVTSGLDRSAIDAIDNGGRGSRRVVDVLRIKDGITLSSSEAGALTAAVALLSVGTLMSSGRISIFGLRAARATHGVALAAVVDALGRDHHARLSPAPVMAPLIITYAVEPKGTVLFAEMLKTGENLSAGHPALALRNFLLTRPGLSGGEAREDVSLKTFAAFGAFAEGRTLHRLLQNTTARDTYVDAWRKANG